jgi:hypothetical protein
MSSKRGMAHFSITVMNYSYRSILRRRAPGSYSHCIHLNIHIFLCAGSDPYFNWLCSYGLSCRLRFRFLFEKVSYACFSFPSHSLTAREKLAFLRSRILCGYLSFLFGVTLNELKEAEYFFSVRQFSSIRSSQSFHISFLSIWLFLEWRVVLNVRY